MGAGELNQRTRHPANTFLHFVSGPLQSCVSTHAQGNVIGLRTKAAFDDGADGVSTRRSLVIGPAVGSLRLPHAQRRAPTTCAALRR